MKKLICCLPIAGDENPSQALMMDGLNQSSELNAIHGVPGKFFVLMRTYLKYRPDYVHFDWIDRYFIRKYPLLTYVSAPLFLLEIWFVRTFTPCQLVRTIHNIQSHDARYPALERYANRQLARRCRWVRVFSQSSVQRAKEYLRIPPEKIRVLPRGSYVGYYPDDVNERQAREFLHVAPADFVVLYLGLVRPYKGIEQLIDAFKQFAQPHWRLVIAGRPHNPVYADELSQLGGNDERIRTVWQFVADDEVQYFFGAADVVVYPFKKIENSGSLILAMGFRKAIIAPRIGVIPERLVAQPELCYDESLTDAFTTLRKYSRDDLRYIGQRNYEQVQKYKWKDFGTFFR